MIIDESCCYGRNNTRRKKKKTHFAAASRCALRTSGFWLRFFLISSREAPTIARLSLVVLRVL